MAKYHNRWISWFVVYIVVAFPGMVVLSCFTQPTWYGFLLVWLIYAVLFGILEVSTTAAGDWWRKRKEAKQEVSR